MPVGRFFVINLFYLKDTQKSANEGSWVLCGYLDDKDTISLATAERPEYNYAEYYTNDKPDPILHIDKNVE